MILRLMIQYGLQYNKINTKYAFFEFPFLLKDDCFKKEVKMRFMNAMHSIAKMTGRDVAIAFDLSRFKTACDVGGNCVE